MAGRPDRWPVHRQDGVVGPLIRLRTAGGTGATGANARYRPARCPVSFQTPIMRRPVRPVQDRQRRRCQPDPGREGHVLAQPARADRAQDVTVGEDQDVTVGRARPLHDLVGARRDPGQGLAVGDAVAPDEPAGAHRLDLGRGHALVRAVVELHQRVPRPRPAAAETGEFAGVARAQQRTGADLRVGQARPRLAVQPFAEQLGAASALVEQRDVRPAGVPAGQRPLRLTVPGEEDARCHGISP